MRRPVAPERFESISDPRGGLSLAEVEDRRLRFGLNQIVERRPGGWRAILKDTARDPMLWFLLGTGGLFAAIGDATEAGVLLVALIPLIGMDAFLHWRTQASTEGLASRLAAQATVVRDGRVAQIPVLDVVVGDLAVVSAGESFPADGIILEGAELQVDESALTGESFPVRKRPCEPARITSRAPIEALHWGLAGTRLLTGEVRVRIACTGSETLYGEIVHSALVERHAPTPLQAAIGGLVKVLLIVAVAMCVLLAAIRLAQGAGFVDALLGAVTLAIAAIPEEFPVVFTVFLSVGVYRLACRRALVRRAVVVENIGRVSCICSDKTGTLTEGRIRLAHLQAADGVAETELLALAGLASRHESGDPVDTAILDAAPAGETGAIERLAVFPFTEGRRRETVVFRQAGRVRAAVKGAPEVVLALTDADSGLAEVWQGRVSVLAAGGHKVIGCAVRDLDQWQGSEPSTGFGFAGLLAFADPVREGVADAVSSCRKAGIRVVMVTGDHPVTATAIASAIGLGGGSPRVIEGTALEALDPSDELESVDVVARAMPAHKLTLVSRLRAAGHVVAVTGDGVNDVPAIQSADIGIAMGERGTRSAREAASIVLLDDNFNTIVDAIAEGRSLFKNLQRSFAYLLMLHVPLVATATCIPLASFPLLYLPSHIVWLELIIHPVAMLAFLSPPRSRRLDAGPIQSISRHHRFFTVGQWCMIGATSLAITGAILIGYVHNLDGANRVEHARGMSMMTLIVASSTVTSALGGLRGAAGRWIVAASLASAVILIQLPAVAPLLHVEPLHLDDLFLAVFLGTITSAPALFFAALGGGASVSVTGAAPRPRRRGSPDRSGAGSRSRLRSGR